MANDDIHIGFDLDGVLLDHSTWKQILARKFGYRLTAAQTTSDAMKALVPDDHRREIQRLIYADDRYALSPSLTSGALELLAALKDRGLRFTLVSRRHDPDLALLLLEKVGLRPGFFDDSNTHFVSSIADKATACTKLGMTHYLDDETGVIAALSAIPHRFLFDPYGNSTTTDARVVRSLEEFGRCVMS